MTYAGGPVSPCTETTGPPYLLKEGLPIMTAPALTTAGPSPAVLQEYRLEIVTEPDQPPLAVVWFTAADRDAALTQARRFVDAHTGPTGRFGELYARAGHLADYVDIIEPTTAAVPVSDGDR
jgi:hypothetical protein